VSIAITSNRYLDELMHKTKALEVEIGERKKAEVALQISYDVLEDRVVERTMELSHANKELQLFRNLTDKLNDFIFVVDPDTSQIIDTNASACLELGYERKELIGKRATDFSIYLSDIHQWKTHVERVAKDGSSVLEGIYRRKNGTTFPVEINTRLVVQDGVRLILGTVRNITERKLMGEALRESRRILSIYNRIANVYLTSSDGDMYSDVLDVILDVMESKHGIFGYMDKNGTLVCPSMTRSVWEQCQIPDKDIVFPPESWGGLWGRALAEKRPMYSNEGFSVPEGHIPMSRFMSVPIIYQDTAIGIINVANKGENYDDNDRDLLESIADHIAPVLNARLERDYEDLQRRTAEN
ncbi:MAG: GAF domain-containing protein, partial [Methanosarcinales archaeon]|nr:GAF domain-containing protein [Methanosarcinales archaeon]